MVEAKDISEELNKKIEEIQQKVYSGEIALLDLELVTLFNNLKDTLTVKNINKHSKSYKEACTLLDQKFKELKNLLGSSTIEKTFIEYLKTNPKEEEIVKLFENCWREVFYMDTLSINFLRFSKNLLCKEKKPSPEEEPIEIQETNEEFIVKIPKHKFTEKMMNYFKSIRNKLPCSFDSLFEEEVDDIKLCKSFVYILHLLQSGMLNYQKETNFLFLEEDE